MSGAETVTKRFRQHWGERTASGAARKALEAMIPGAALATIPINVQAAAKFVGIEQIVQGDLQGVDGLLSLTSSGTYVVTLKREQSRIRKRFTLAHEIGHLVVFNSVGRRDGSIAANNLGCRTANPEDLEEERLCDLVASELLMPREAFLQQMQLEGVCALSIPAIARDFDVSLHAASRRVVDLLGYEIGVSWWGLSESASHLVPRWYLTRKGSMALPYAIDVKHASASHFSDKPVRGWHWLALQGQMDKYYVDIHPLPGTVKSWLLVVVFGDAAQQILAQIGAGRGSLPTRQLPLVED
jgi:hypothetical protein